MTYSKRNCLITGLIGGGLILSLSAILTYLLSPSLVKYIVSQKLILSSPDSEVYGGWKLSPVPIYTKFYFFNVTNPKDVSSGKSGPILQELGPYTFYEVREKMNISWNHADGTVSYKQVKRYRHLPEMTTGSLKDRVYHLNIPLAGMIAQAKYKNDAFIYSFIEQVTTGNDDELFLNHTIGELLFEGYHDDLLEFIDSNGLSPVPVSPFSFFKGRNGTDTDGQFTIYSGEAGTLDHLGFLHSWNGQQRLNFWKSEKCNSFDNTWPGDLRPPYPSTSPPKLRLFAPDLCRSLELTYLTKKTTAGIDTVRYWADSSLFDYTLEENKCYCLEESCPPNGIFNTSVCTHGSPASISFPHYMFADPVYSKNIQGLNPDLDKHIFYMDVEPNLGVPVETFARIQFNMAVEKDDNTDLTSNLTDSFNLPIFWTETSAKLSDDIASNLILLHKHVPSMILTATCVQVALAVVLLVITLICILKINAFKELVAKPSRPAKPSRRTRPPRKEYNPVVTTSFQS